MPVIPSLLALHDEMTAWRRELHRHPETAYEEHWTSDFVAGLLSSWGIEVHRGLGGTGVVGVLSAGSSERSIALRAELDALPIIEATGAPHASANPGKMHACGHDGHMAMLLGAACYLARTRSFDGTVYLIFQPAEENEAGARRMIEEGLFRDFPAERVFGMHNLPGIEIGEFAARDGAITAALDLFEISIRGRSCHAAMPHTGRDPIVCAAALVSALQTITTRDVPPLGAAVVSATQFHAGNSWNVIPELATIRGTVRTFDAAVRDTIEGRMREMARHLAEAHGCSAEVDYDRRYPAAVNTAPEVSASVEALRRVVDPHRVNTDAEPILAAEDFAFMLQERPGSYVFVGNGNSEPVHSPGYDFDDRVLPFGASYWVALTERALASEERST